MTGDIRVRFRIRRCVSALCGTWMNISGRMRLRTNCPGGFRGQSVRKRTVRKTPAGEARRGKNDYWLRQTLSTWSYQRALAGQVEL